jgi:hypothetical protein
VVAKEAVKSKVDSILSKFEFWKKQTWSM